LPAKNFYSFAPFASNLPGYFSIVKLFLPKINTWYTIPTSKNLTDSHFLNHKIPDQCLS